MATTSSYNGGMTTQLEAVEKHNEQVAPEFRIVEKGMIIANHKVLRCKRLSERIIGDSYATWVVLCEAEGNEYHKWVTWIVAATPRGFNADSGHYFMEIDGIEKAVGSYEKRGGW